MKLGLVALLPCCWLASLGSVMAESAPVAADYDLVVQDELVSVHVTDGSLIGLVGELGRRLGFEVIAHDVADTPLTANFDRLPQSRAIRILCQKVGYVEVPDAVTGKTVRLVLTPSRSVAANRVASRRDPLPPLPEADDDPFAPLPVVEDPTPPPTDDAGSSIP